MIGFLGALLIVRPGFAAIDPAALLAIGTAAVWATSTVLIKVMARTESAGAITTYMVLLTTPMTLIAALFVWQTPSLEQLGWAALLGAAGSTGHICMSRALAAADATLVAPLDYLRLPIVALIAFLAFGEVPNVWVWIGGGVIAASSIYIAQREARLKGAPYVPAARGGPGTLVPGIINAWTTSSPSSRAPGRGVAIQLFRIASRPLVARNDGMDGPRAASRVPDWWF